MTGDITDPAQCAALVAQAQAVGGDLTALVCNAGAAGPGQLADLPVAQWDATFNLNTRSAWLLAQEWAADGIRVNTVCPGMIRTPLTEAVYQDAETL